MSNDNNTTNNRSQAAHQKYPERVQSPNNGIAAEFPDDPTGSSSQDGSSKSGASLGKQVRDLLNEYSVVMMGGKARVVRFRNKSLANGPRQDVLDVTSEADFRMFYRNKTATIAVAGKNGSTVRNIPAADLFFQQAKRYDALVYEPHQGPTVGGALNLWRDFGVSPKAGSWARMHEHIYEVLSNGDEEQARYIVKWCAWAVQNPGQQAEVAIVLQGREGTGKGAFAQMLLRMFGIHGKHISDRAHMVGNFNKHLMHTSVLFADEAFWAGDKRAEGTLKRLITEPTLTIEPKGIDAFSMPNHLHILMASNEDWVVPAGKDARRFAVFGVSAKKIGDKAYFKRLWAETLEDGPSAMLHDLLLMDLHGWHPREGIPQTEALREQKLLSLKGVPKLVFMLANEVTLPCIVNAANPAGVATAGEGYGTGFISYARRQVRSMSHMSGTMIKKELVKYWGCSYFNRNSVRGLDFPRRIELIRMFEERYGQQDWENREIEDWQLPLGWKAGGDREKSHHSLED